MKKKKRKKEKDNNLAPGKIEFLLKRRIRHFDVHLVDLRYISFSPFSPNGPKAKAKGTIKTKPNMRTKAKHHLYTVRRLQTVYIIPILYRMYVWIHCILFTIFGCWRCGDPLKGMRRARKRSIAIYTIRYYY